MPVNKLKRLCKANEKKHTALTYTSDCSTLR